jgi:hypothetical protein
MTMSRSVCAVVVVVFACAGSPPEPQHPIAPEVPPAATLAPPDSHFVVEVGGSVTTPLGTLPLVSTQQIHRGDGLFLTLKTTRRTKLYVAYCDTSQKLAIYPVTGNLVGQPDALTRVPQSESFIADASTGLEHIFVIATADALERSDPKLHELISRAQGAAGTPCSTQLAMTSDESRAQASLSPNSTQPAKLGRTGAASALTVDLTKRYAAVPKVWRPRGFALDETASKTTSSSSSDDAGIAIWAITLEHK